MPLPRTFRSKAQLSGGFEFEPEKQALAHGGNVPKLESDDAPSGRLAVANQKTLHDATELTGEELDFVESCLGPCAASDDPLTLIVRGR